MTEKELAQASENLDIANGIANEAGFDNINDLVAKANADMKSSSVIKQDAGMKLAEQTVEKLIKLVLYQTIQGTNLGNLPLADAFEDGYITQGNAKSYNVNLTTGHSVYEKTLFVPTQFTSTHVENFLIQMYAENGQLNKDQAYQFCKTKVYAPEQWMPYFTSGNLAQFIAIIRAEMEQTFRAFKYHKIMDKITNKMVTAVEGKKNKITGTALNLFDAMAGEVLPLLREIQTPNSRYNFNENNKYINNLQRDNIIVLMNPKTLERISSGIQSQLYNAQFLDLQKVVNSENIPTIGRKFKISGEENTGNDTIIEIEDTFYVPENRIIILDKSMMKHLYQVNRATSQTWAENMAISIYLHVWGALDYLPWGTFIVYENSNLTKLPGREELDALALASSKKSK